MQQFFLQILPLVLTFFGGQGVQYWLNVRSNRKQLSTKVAVEEFEGVQSVVDKYIAMVEQMNPRMEKLYRQIEELQSEVNKERLIKSNLLTDLNKMMNDCHCSDSVKQRIVAQYKL
jgi:archaellum component FlaC